MPGTYRKSPRRLKGAAIVSGMIVCALAGDALATGPSTPTVDDANNAIEGNINSRFSGGLKIVDVKKTDGQSGQSAGIPFYTLEFRVNTEAIQTLYESSGRWALYTPPRGWFHSVPAFGRLLTQDPYDPSIWKGEKYTVDGEAQFTMKESGWVIQGVSINGITPLDVSSPSSTQARHAIERGLQYATVGGLKIISIEPKSGMRMGEKYRVPFRSVVEGMTDDIKFEAGILRKLECATLYCSSFKGQPSIRKGQTYTIDGTLDFIQKMGGWWSAAGLALQEPKLGTKPVPLAQGATAEQSHVQAAERKLADRQPFSAFAPAGFTCRPDATITVRAPDEAAFTSNRVELQKLVGGLRAILGFECPDTAISNLVVVGEAGGREVYRGAASGSGNWLLADLRRSPVTTSAPAGQETAGGAETSAQSQKTAPPRDVGIGQKRGVVREENVAQPSFDCSNARSWSEREVCGDAMLADMDVKMASLFRNKKSQPDRAQAEVLVRDQKQWLRDRDNCNLSPAPSQCLIDIYNKRISELSLGGNNRDEPLEQSAEAQSTRSAPSTPEQAPLIQASGDGNLEKVRELLAKGADVNAKRNDGETALLVASRKGDAGVVRELLTKGADVNARDRLGDTALNIASDKGYQNIVDLLKLKAAPVVSGMTMEQVLLVRGAPNRKEVIPPDMELWHYPASDVAFQNGKVSYVELQ